MVIPAGNGNNGHHVQQEFPDKLGSQYPAPPPPLVSTGSSQDLEHESHGGALDEGIHDTIDGPGSSPTSSSAIATQGYVKTNIEIFLT